MNAEGRVGRMLRRGGLEDRFSIERPAHKDEPLATVAATGLVQLPSLVSRPYLAVLSWLLSFARYASAVGPSSSPALRFPPPSCPARAAGETSLVIHYLLEMAGSRLQSSQGP